MTATLIEYLTAPHEEGFEPLVPVFVYGTLRVDQYNYDWCKRAVRHSVIDCKAKGNLYWVHDKSGYPVAKFDEDGEIIGDVLYFDPTSKTYDDVVSMELGAGYEVREIEVRTPEGETLECIAFHYVDRPRGEWIKSGDWVSESRW